MINVIVFGMTENPGGVESFLMNYYRNIDRDKISLDFLCNSYEKIAYEDEILAMGGKTFHISPRSKKPLTYKKELEAFFEKNAGNYDAIWVNVSSLANIDYLIYAKKYGIKKRIIHSHNSQNMDSRLRGLLHEKNRKVIDRYATDFWACSVDAGKWFYEDRLKNQIIYIHNAIDLEKMSFSEDKRNAVRKELGFTDNLIIGNVGRLHFQKNQEFAVKIFAELLKKRTDSRLVLVGQGPDKEKLEALASELGVSDNIFFAGVQSDIQAWLSAFDVFLFPSVFEGLSVAALEAQANGVPMLASDGVIPKELKINSNFNFYSLDRSAADWADTLVSMDKKRADRSDIRNKFGEAGYDIKTEARRLEELLSD